MCGIIGSIDLDIKKGLDAIAHRGKDGKAAINFGAFKLGHCRLSILDLNERSNQPFIYRNFALLYNGELWNYLELKQELIDLGYKFETTGDTEVVAVALYHWGAKAFKRFNGMFALAWTDGSNLALARDKFGETPIYYNERQGFAFASEQKGLTALGLTNNQLLPGGCYIRYTPTGVKHKKYYYLPDKEIVDDEIYAATKLRGLMEQAVKEREISDVPICTLLSGGLDSALITALLARNFPDIVAYTAVFNKKSKDLAAARQLTKDLGIKLIEVEIPPPTIEDIKSTIFCIENYLKTQVEIAYPCIKLAEVISKDGFKVVFSGDGSDEMFGSYRFAYHGIRKDGYNNYIRKLYHSLSYKNYIRNNKAFLSHSVEVRLPFANTKLVEYILNLPQEVVYDERDEKRLLKMAMKNIVPDYIIQRRKIGFQDGLGIKNAFKSVIEPSYYRRHYKSLFE